MNRRRLMAIGWPAFLAASVLELVVFGVLDPQALEGVLDVLSLSRQGVYTLGFFVFWAISAVACALTDLLNTPVPTLPLD